MTPRRTRPKIRRVNAEATARGGAAEPAPSLARRLGPFDATMIVMGAIIGSGIFMNPYVVAQQVRTPFLILAVWAAGGLIALAGAFIYAELAARRPHVGGQYAYIREAYHPALAFLYGWGLLLVIQTGGMAAVGVTFARYFVALTGMQVPDWLLASTILGVLTIINCFGVRAGATAQNILMLLKIGAIAALVLAGVLLAPESAAPPSGLLDRPVSFDLLTAFGAALVPVMFSYGGWQTANFIAGEIREPRRNLPRGLVWGVLGVVTLYLAVNYVSVRALGAPGLAATEAPASDVMRAALGEAGARFIAAGIAISTLGFLSNTMLTAPRVYYAMAEDGLFFRRFAWLHPRTRVPVVAIAAQGALAIVIALSGRYEQILNYVVPVDFIFFGLSATCVFVFRRRDAQQAAQSAGSDDASFVIPGHPFTTVFFIVACWLVVANALYKSPGNSAIGLLILLAGLPAYAYWARRRA